MPYPSDKSRTLQTMRSNGTLAYSQIVRKVYYRAEDVQRIIPFCRGTAQTSRIKRKKTSDLLYLQNH